MRTNRPGFYPTVCDSPDYSIPFETLKKLIIGGRKLDPVPVVSQEVLGIREQMTLDEQHRAVLPGEHIRFKVFGLLTINATIEVIWPSSFSEEISYKNFEKLMKQLLSVYNTELHEWIFPFITTNKHVAFWPNEKVLKSIIELKGEEFFL